MSLLILFLAAVSTVLRNVREQDTQADLINTLEVR
jgi:hypothetical protein